MILFFLLVHPVFAVLGLRPSIRVDQIGHVVRVCFREDANRLVTSKACSFEFEVLTLRILLVLDTRHFAKTNTGGPRQKYGDD